MKTLPTFIGPCGALFAVVVQAHAAPSQPEPTPKLRPGVFRGAVAAMTMKVEALPSTAKCGERIKQAVLLTNKTAKEWKGTVGYVSGLGPSNDTATVPPNGSKSVDLILPALNCTKPLDTYKVQAWNGEAAGNPIFAKTMKPITVKSEEGWPSPSNTNPWLRRVWLDGKCGATLTAKMGLHTSSLQAQSARVKLTLGAATKEETVQVQNTNTFVTVETPLDCQAQTGIPSFDFALLDGNPTNGTLKATVGFEPQP